MRHLPTVIALALAFVIAIPCVAHSTDANVLPADQPVILGKVTRITSHSIIVLTRDGESLPIEFDSRTMMTTSMPTGSRVRVEFRLLDSGRYLAQRITPLERGSDAWAALDFRRLLRNRPKKRAVAPAVYSAKGTDSRGTDSQGTTRTDAAPAQQTTPDVIATDGIASNASAETQAAAANADVEKEPLISSPVPVALVTGLLMLVGLLLFWRGRRPRRRA